MKLKTFYVVIVVDGLGGPQQALAWTCHLEAASRAVLVERIIPAVNAHPDEDYIYRIPAIARALAADIGVTDRGCPRHDSQVTMVNVNLEPRTIEFNETIARIYDIDSRSWMRLRPTGGIVPYHA